MGAHCAGQEKPKRKFKLEANSKEFWALIAPETQLVTVASGFGFTEGPVWDSHGFVFVSDEVKNNPVVGKGKQEETK